MRKRTLSSVQKIRNSDSQGVSPYRIKEQALANKLLRNTSETAFKHQTSKTRPFSVFKSTAHQPSNFAVPSLHPYSSLSELQIPRHSLNFSANSKSPTKCRSIASLKAIKGEGRSSLGACASELRKASVLHVRNMSINRKSQANILSNAMNVRYSKVRLRGQHEKAQSLNVLHCKAEGNTKMREMAHEQFAVLAEMKESQINDFTVLTKANLTSHFHSLGFHKSLILDNVADYLVKVIPKLNFKGYYRFLNEGLLSNCLKVQKEICYSIYANFKEKLYLTEIYAYFDDPLWKIIINDLLIVNAKLSEKQGTLKTREATALRKFGNSFSKQCARSNSFLIIDSCGIEKKFQVELPEEQEVKMLIESKDTFISFTEFSAISFPETVPELLYFIIHLLCGEDLMNYYTEVIGVKSYQYGSAQKSGRVEYFVSRRVIDHHENNLQMENKQIAKIVRKLKPAVKQRVINAVIRLYRAFKLDSAGRNAAPDFSVTISKERFITTTVRDCSK